jgi:hypothetical protein
MRTEAAAAMRSSATSGCGHARFGVSPRALASAWRCFCTAAFSPGHGRSGNCLRRRPAGPRRSSGQRAAARRSSAPWRRWRWRGSERGDLL